MGEHLRGTVVQLLPAIMSVVVGLGLAYTLTLSRFGTVTASTLIVAALIVGITTLGVLTLALGKQDLATGIGLVVLAGGFLGFALGPQLWIAGLLLLVSSEIERPVVPFVFLVFITPLLALTVVTSPGEGTAVTALAVTVFLVATASTLAAQVPRWRRPRGAR